MSFNLVHQTHLAWRKDWSCVWDTARWAKTLENLVYQTQLAEQKLLKLLSIRHRAEKLLSIIRDKKETAQLCWSALHQVHKRLLVASQTEAYKFRLAICGNASYSQFCWLLFIHSSTAAQMGLFDNGLLQLLFRNMISIEAKQSLVVDMIIEKRTVIVVL